MSEHRQYRYPVVRFYYTALYSTKDRELDIGTVFVTFEMTQFFRQVYIIPTQSGFMSDLKRYSWSCNAFDELEYSVLYTVQSY